MSQYKQCPNGHYYEGDACPYCKTRLYPEPEDLGFNPASTADPDMLYPDPPVEIINIPTCPHCGHSIKNDLPHPQFPVIGSIEGNAYDGKVPWNYGWEGKCEHCGHNFSINMTQRLHSPKKDRHTTIKVSSRRISTGVDSCIGLSGVEIEQNNSTDGVNRMFISTNELKYIIKSLKDSPLLEQLDWNEDRT